MLLTRVAVFRSVSMLDTQETQSNEDEEDADVVLLALGDWECDRISSREDAKISSSERIDRGVSGISSSSSVFSSTSRGWRIVASARRDRARVIARL